MKFQDNIKQRITGRHKKSFSFVNDVKDKIVLDIGCSFGWFEKWAIENNCKKIIGIEPNEINFNSVKDAILGATFKKGSVQSIPSENDYFDIVVMWEVLEHLPKNAEFESFQEIRRVLKPDCSLFISVPNKYFWSCITDPAWWLIGHRHYDINKLKEELVESGFEVVKIEYGGGFYESFSMILLYIFKWFFRREIPFKKLLDKRRDNEFSNMTGFTNIFVEARKSRSIAVCTKMKKILLTGSPFTWNYGSIALIVSAIDTISEEFPNTYFFKGSIDLKTDKKKYSNYFTDDKLKIFGFNSGKKCIFLSTPLLALRSIQYMMKSDLVLEASGEIHDDTGVFSLLLRTIIAKIFRKPFVIYALGFGPYKNKIIIPFLKYCIDMSDMVIVREEETYNYLRGLKISKKKYVTADHAFLFRSLSHEKTLILCKKVGIENFEPFIIISPKNGYQKWPQYLEGLLVVIENILENYNKNILILPHGNEDVQISRKLYSYFENSSQVRLIDEILLPHEAKGIIRLSEFVISSRVHGGISAISQNIPAIFLIPLEDHRGKGILGRQYDLMDFVVDPRLCGDIIDILPKHFASKEDIIEKIKIKNKTVFSKSKENVNLISRFLK